MWKTAKSAASMQPAMIPVVRSRSSVPTNVVSSTAAVRQGLVYVTEVLGYLHCLDAATGKVIWFYEVPGEINSGCNFYKDQITLRH